MEKHAHIAILGLGLLGSSVARACKQYQPGCKITAFDMNPLALEFGKQHGFVDTIAKSANVAVKNSDMVVIAAPPTVSTEMIGAIRTSLPKGVMVTDVVSVKSPIAKAMQSHFKNHIRYVPAHPIAGSEQTGVAAGRADLFAGKRIILTPDTPNDEGIEEITGFWQQLGGVVEYMPPEIHDMVYAHVSHLPQLLAFAIKPKVDELLALHTTLPSSFTPFSRLCFSDRRLWDDIFLNNKPELDKALARFLVMFTHIRSELADGMVKHGGEETISEIRLWTELMPRLIGSCLIGCIFQESKQVGFNFMHFAGKGFHDFIAPLKEAPDKHLEDISNFAKPVVSAMDELLANLTEWVVIKS